MSLLPRYFSALALIALCATIARSQTTASDLFPLDLGHFNNYNAFATDTTGIPDNSSKTSASFTVWRTGQSFKGLSGVAWAKDTSNETKPSNGSESNQHYKAAVNGDILAYADSNFMQIFIPSNLQTGITPPDSFVNYIALSAGLNKKYSVAHLNQAIVVSGLTLNTDITISGKFAGIEKVTVPAGTFDSAYKFIITGVIQISLLGTITGNQTLWVVKGIGIVKTNQPTISKAILGNSIVIPGSERDMTLAGTKAIDDVHFTTSSSSLNLYPNPVNNLLTVHCDGITTPLIITAHSLSTEIETNLYAGPSGKSISLSTSSLPSGSYIISVISEGELISQEKCVVIH
jgi:hypothetical protein